MFRLNYEINAIKTFEMVRKAYGKPNFSCTTVFEWRRRCRNGRKSVQDDTREGRPRTSVTDENGSRVRELFAIDRRLNLRLLARDSKYLFCTGAGDRV